MAMMKDLTHEIDRILGSAYPTQLLVCLSLLSAKPGVADEVREQKLHEIVKEQCDEVDLVHWASTRPCAVRPLASCLLQELRQWPYVLDIIVKLAVNQYIRDALIQEDPQLLPTLLARAVKKHGISTRYITASIAFLSTPLPSTVALPSEVQTLFVRLVENAAQSPSAASIEPVYLLLRGVGPLLFRLIDHDTLCRLEEDILGILRSAAGLPDQCLSMYCLSIMKTACAAADPTFRLTNSSYTTDDFLASTPSGISRWTSETMQQFFTGSRAQKSIQLIVLIVLATTKSLSEQKKQRIRSLVLANEIISAIPTDLRRVWCASNHLTVRKVYEKACSESLDDAVSVLMFRFLKKLCEMESMPDRVVTSIMATFTRPQRLRWAHIYLEQHEEQAMAGMLPRLDIEALLRGSIRAPLVDGQPDVVCINAAASMLESVSTVVAVDDATIQYGIGYEALSEILHTIQQHFQAIANPIPRVGQGQTCVAGLHRARWNLIHHACRLMLQMSLSKTPVDSSSTPVASSLPPRMIRELLDLLDQSTTRKNDLCAHARKSTPQLIDLIETSATPDSTLIPWRDALQNHLASRAKAEQAEITPIFTRACADLEMRCENVERPLRQACEKYDELEVQHRDLTTAFAELEAKNVDLNLHVHALQREGETSAEELAERRDEIEELQRRIEEMSSLHEKVQLDHRMDLEKAEELRKRHDLDKRASLARKQEELEDLAEAVEEMQAVMRTKDDRIAELQAICAETEKQLETVKIDSHERVAEHERQLEQQSDFILKAQSITKEVEAQLHEEMRKLLDTETQLEAVRTDLANERARREEAQFKLDALQKTTAEEQASRGAMETAHHELVADLQHQLHLQREVARDLGEARLRVEDELINVNTRASELEAQLHALHDDYAKKEAQIADADALRSNLLAAMGLPTDAHLRSSGMGAQSSLPDRSRERYSRDLRHADESLLSLEMQCSGVSEPHSEPSVKKRARQRGSEPIESQIEGLPQLTSGNRRRTTAARPTSRRPAPGVKTRAPLGVLADNERPRIDEMWNAAAKEVGKRRPEGRENDDETTFEGGGLFSGTQTGGTMEF